MFTTHSTAVPLSERGAGRLWGYNEPSDMKRKIGVLFFGLIAAAAAQRKDFEQPAMHAARGTHAAVAAGSEYATEAGMRMYYHGGNAVDAGVAAMYAASVSEFSHFGLGGEAPILIRTKAGKVISIAGVGTMPKLATAEMFRERRPRPGEILTLDPGGLKGIIPVAGIMPALVPSMVESGLVALREYGTKSFNEVIQPAIELADGLANRVLQRLRNAKLAYFACLALHQIQRGVPRAIGAAAVELAALAEALRQRPAQKPLAGDDLRKAGTETALRGGEFGTAETRSHILYTYYTR